MWKSKTEAIGTIRDGNGKHGLLLSTWNLESRSQCWGMVFALVTREMNSKAPRLQADAYTSHQ